MSNNKVKVNHQQQQKSQGRLSKQHKEDTKLGKLIMFLILYYSTYS